jgi:hypothetical protein
MTDPDVKFGENLMASCIAPVIVVKQLGHAAPPAKALVEEARDAPGMTHPTGTVLGP